MLYKLFKKMHKLKKTFVTKISNIYEWLFFQLFMQLISSATTLASDFLWNENK